MFERPATPAFAALAALAAIVALAPIAPAQDSPPPADQPAAGRAETSPPAHDATSSDSGVLHVTGLTDLNAGVVQIALEGLARPAWHCVDCDLTRAASGACPQCKEPMIQIEQTILDRVEVDLKAGTIHFDVEPGERARLSEIQSALTRYKIAFPVEQQGIPHRSALRVSGPASQDDVGKLVAELLKSKLFEKVTGSFDAAEKQAELTVVCVGSPPRSQVEAALTKAGADSKLADIVFLPRTGAISSRN